MGSPQINWRTSSYTTNGADCVEVGAVGHRIGIRDSKNPDRPFLALRRDQFCGLTKRIKRGASQ